MPQFAAINNNKYQIIMSNQLKKGQSISVGGALTSTNGSYTLKLQSDGNCVLYEVDGNKALWSTDTQGKASKSLTLQEEGNLVLASSDGSTLWQSGTKGEPTVINFIVQDDGNMVIYIPSGAIWASNTGVNY